MSLRHCIRQESLFPPFFHLRRRRWCGVTLHATGVGGGGRKEETPLFLGERPNNGGSKITAFREQKGRDPHTARRSSYKTFLSHVRTCIALSAQGDFFPLLPIYTSRSPLSRPIALKQRREGGRGNKRSIMYSRIFFSLSSPLCFSITMRRRRPRPPPAAA